MPVNASPHYKNAEGEYLNAQTTEKKIAALKKMISLAPSHKGAENLRSQLKKRLARLKYAGEKETRKGKSGWKGIRKEETQAVIVGMTNTGKSSLLRLLTNASPEISGNNFTTKTPKIGMMQYGGTNTQIIENPAWESEYYDRGLIHSADTILITATELSQIKEIREELNPEKTQIIIFNLKNGNDEKRRKIAATLQSRKREHVIIDLSSEKKEKSGEIKEKIFKSFGKIRVYTKRPDEKEKNREKPLILEKDSEVKKVAEKILHGFSRQVKEIRIWGPSSRFPGQVVGMKHRLKDLDVVEFKTG